MADVYHHVRGIFNGQSLRSWISARRNGTAIAAPPILKPFGRQKRRWYRPSRSWILMPLLLLFCLIYGFAFALFAPYVLVPFGIPILVLLLLIIWAMPDAVAPVKTLNFFFFAFFIGLIAWPNYISLALPGLPWISVKRLTVFPLVILLLYSVSVSQDFRKTLGTALNNTPLIWKAMATLAVIQTLSVGLSSNPTFSLSKLVIAQTEWTAIFFVSCYVFLKPGRPTRWAIFLWCLALFVGAMGLWEDRLGHVPWRDHIPSLLQIDDPAVSRALAGSQRSALGLHRVQSVFTTSLGLSEFMALTLPFIFHFLRTEFNWKVRLAAAVSIPSAIYVIVISQSRLGLVGSIVTILSFILIWAIRRRIADKHNPFWTGIIVGYPLIFSTIIASTFFVGRIHARVWGNGPQQFSDQSRLEQWRLGIPKILTHPWGYGIGMGNESLGFSDPGGFSTIDSYYLLVALEYGIIGFVVYYGMFFLALYLTGKKAISPQPLEDESALLIPGAVALLNFIVIKGVFAQQDNHPIIFMMLGMLVALLWRYRDTLAPRTLAKPVGRTIKP